MTGHSPQRGPSAARRLVGMAVITLGLAGDLGACFLLVGGHPLMGLASHVPAVGVWTLGIYVLTATSTLDQLYESDEAMKKQPSGSTFNGWTIAAAMLGLFTFPGIGTAGVSLAFGFSYLFRQRAIPRSTLGETLASLQVPALSMRPAGLEQASQVLSIVDVLRQQNTEMRRAVVRTLGFQGDKESVDILRRLLTDANPDVRSDAAVILTRLENDYNQRILKALEQIEDAPDDLEKHLQLARRYYEFAESGLLDPVSRRHYLRQAERIFSEASEAQPARLSILFERARVTHLLGRSNEAIAMLTHLLEQRPDDNAAYALLLEVAFAQQEWGIVLALSQRPHGLTKEQAEVLRWWTEIIPPAWKGAVRQHG